MRRPLADDHRDPNLRYREGWATLPVWPLTFAIIFLFLSAAQLRASLIPFNSLLYTAVSDNIHDTQRDTILGPPPLPFWASHTATMSPSAAQADYAFQLGANYVD